MTDYGELKQACHDCNNLSGPEFIDAMQRFESLTSPDQVLALIAENERLERKNDNQAQTIREYSDLVMGGDVSLGMLRADLRVTSGERDQLKAEVEALRKDAERFYFIQQDAPSMFTSVYGENWIEVVDSYISPSKESSQ